MPGGRLKPSRRPAGSHPGHPGASVLPSLPSHREPPAAAATVPSFIHWKEEPSWSLAVGQAAGHPPPPPPWSPDPQKARFGGALFEQPCRPLSCQSQGCGVRLRSLGHFSQEDVCVQLVPLCRSSILRRRRSVDARSPGASAVQGCCLLWARGVSASGGRAAQASDPCWSAHGLEGAGPQPAGGVGPWHPRPFSGKTGRMETVLQFCFVFFYSRREKTRIFLSFLLMHSENEQ